MSEKRTVEQRLTAIEVALQLVLSPEHRALINSSDIKEMVKEVIQEIKQEENRLNFDAAQLQQMFAQERQKLEMQRQEFTAGAEKGDISF